MNEAETRAELIDPKLRNCGWGVEAGSQILREESARLTAGRIQAGGGRSKALKADYILVYKGVKLAVVEAKARDVAASEGVMQAKLYADMLQLRFTYATNGRDIYEINMSTGEEKTVTNFMSPQEMWNSSFGINSATAVAIPNPELQWQLRFAEIPFEDKSGQWQLRYYQENAINNTLQAIAKGKNRILLTLATGTGKTAIAFQIAWKLFQTRWNIQGDNSRRPRILFLADRNILADQAYNAFSAFPDDALIRIRPNEVANRGRVPTNGNIFFTIFQTFMSGRDEKGNPAPNFGEYPKDFFDFIIIDECHRGGANDESNWRAIMEYFSPAVQLGLTATPKRTINIDTYRYFGEPVYIYSLKQGINDGFLTPFKVKRIQTTIDDYIYTSDDTILEGEVEEGRRYVEDDFNRIIQIQERERKRVEIYLDDCNQNEKAIIFCATQAHAAMIRDIVNQMSRSNNTFYCVRVTANDGAEGERQLREFQDNEKTIPTILTTSQKLSTGVDARNIRNIVLMRKINSMIEFKQIIGRGTRLFDGKEYFTIYDFVGAYQLFSDPEWDGEPMDPEPCQRCGQIPCVCEANPPKPCKVCGQRPCICKKEEAPVCEQCGQRPCICTSRSMLVITLADGKERNIRHMVSTSFWSADGTPISAQEFLEKLFGELPNLFSNEEELRRLWSNPLTRKSLLEKLDEAGFPKTDLQTLQILVDMERSDLFDVLEFVFNGNHHALTRQQRAQAAKSAIVTLLNEKQREFIEFVLNKYAEVGNEELELERLPILLRNKYKSIEDAKQNLGENSEIQKLFIEFQQHLYRTGVA